MSRRLHGIALICCTSMAFAGPVSGQESPLDILKNVLDDANEVQSQIEDLTETQPDPSSPSQTDDEDVYEGDPYFKKALNKALETGHVERESAWNNPQTGAHGTITPLGIFHDMSGLRCRNYRSTLVSDVASRFFEGSACRVASHNWEVKDEVESSPQVASSGTVSGLAGQQAAEPPDVTTTQSGYNDDRQMVADAQHLLSELGYDVGAVDGVYGGKTRQAIAAFERDRGQTASGNVTPELLVLLSQETKVKQTLPSVGPTQMTESSSGGDFIDEASAIGVPLTSSQMALLAIRDLPDAIDDAQLVALTKAQIEREQFVWENIDRTLKQTTRLNPDRPAFIFEWQRLEEERSDLAMGAVLDVLLGPRMDWSFVKSESGWDDQFEAIVEAFVFARDEIDGRNPEFAARQLSAVTKRLLEAAASQVPSQFQITVDLPAVAYDFEAGAIRFKSDQGDSFQDEGIDILRPVRRPIFSSETGSGGDSSSGSMLPDSARAAALYETWQAVPADERIKRVGKSISAEAPSDSLRSFFSLGSQYWRGTQVLAFDRHLKLLSVPLDSATAEPLLNEHRGGKGLKARITLEADRMEPAEEVSEGRSYKASVLFSTVLGVDILDRNGNVVSSLGAETFRTTEQEETVVAQANQQAQEQQASILQGKAAILSEVDVVGIQLKTPFDEAEASVRDRMDVESVVEYGITPKVPEAFVDFRGFHGRDKSESIVLFKGSGDSNQLIAIARVVKLAPEVDLETVRRKLKEKYGENPDQDHKSFLEWTASQDPVLCRVTIGWDRSGLRLLEGEKIDGSAPYTSRVRLSSYTVGKAPDTEAWKACGPTVQAQLTDSTLTVLLYDLALYASHFPKGGGEAGTESKIKSSDLDL